MVVMKFCKPDLTNNVNVSPNRGYGKTCFYFRSIATAAATFALVATAAFATFILAAVRLSGAPLPPERPPVVEGHGPTT
jgi:hypothetical protein